MQNAVVPPFVGSSQAESDEQGAELSGIVSRIAHYARSTPQSLAVRSGSATLTFAELNRQSNHGAAQLRQAGVVPGSCVGIFLERSPAFVVAALAVLKTGAAYLPLDSATPIERMHFILSDAEAALLLTDGGRPTAISGCACPVLVMKDAGAVNGDKQLFDFADPSPDSLAYVIYTSGSTGHPKGVEITHANLLNLIDWHQAAFGVTAADRASQVAGLGFDAAGWEIWPHLTAGASVHMADEATRRSPQALRDWLVAEKITVSFAPTALAEQLLHSDWPAETALRILLTGADTLHRRPRAGLPFTLVNNYGPTECTVVATSGAVKSESVAEGAPSIGRPIAKTTAFILDDHLVAVPNGQPGELCLAGALVGRGYRNNPAMTASRFVMYTPPSGSAVRIYRTGDRVRLTDTGEIAFLGRLDDQVKIRGYRIELGEIISCLDRFLELEASAVIARDDAGTGPELVAYVVLTPGAKVTSVDLREFLAARLPDYMIPSKFVAMPALPITANGKLDKAALPVPGAQNLLPGVKAPLAEAPPGSAIEQRLTALVTSLLGNSSCGREDNFFMAGGHSMLGVQLVARIRDTFGVKLHLRQLFGAPTIVALTVEIEKMSAAAAAAKAG
jgi:amino acid adenylation domain-containing protein